jgi:hypothetical protein
MQLARRPVTETASRDVSASVKPWNNCDVPHYRLHFTRADGVTTTDDHDSERELAVGDLVEHDGRRWVVQEVEHFGLEDYDGFVAVVPADGDGD